MPGNSFGKIFNFTSFGESHGVAIGGIVDGMPANISLCESDIQPWLDERRPGQSAFTTQRNEEDKVKLLSGIFEGKTTGTPIGFMIENTNQHSKDYSEISSKFRPNHADYTYMQKYGIRDYRGGGRSSARETATRVVTGAIGYKLLKHFIKNIEIKACVTQIGKIKINPNNFDWAEVSNNPFFAPDKEVIPLWEDLIKQMRDEGNSVGAIIEVRAINTPAGLGEPVFDRLDAEIAKAMMSINAVKGIEIGNGFEAASITGAENADEITTDADGNIQFMKNNSGGILGGISNGDEIIARIALKPTSSILIDKQTIDNDGNKTSIATKGRHDPCVGIRAVPIAKAMMACVLADHFLRQRATYNR